MFERGRISDRSRLSNRIDRSNQRTRQMQNMAIDQMSFFQEEKPENLKDTSDVIVDDPVDIWSSVITW